MVHVCLKNFQWKVPWEMVPLNVAYKTDQSLSYELLERTFFNKPFIEYICPV